MSIHKAKFSHKRKRQTTRTRRSHTAATARLRKMNANAIFRLLFFAGYIHNCTSQFRGAGGDIRDGGETAIGQSTSNSDGSTIALFDTKKYSGCQGNSPVFPGFSYPSYGNADDAGAESLFGTICTESHFYRQSFPIQLVDNDGIIQSVTCEDAVENPNKYGPNQGIPANDDEICCSLNFRFQFDSVIESNARLDTPVNFTIDDVYPNQQNEFVQLCESLWACQNYQNTYTALQCEDRGTIGCTDIYNTSLCFGSLYDTRDEGGIQSRADFIVSSCYGAGEADYNFTHPNPYTIESLTEVVEMSCQMAQDLSDRLLFTPSSEELCDELIECNMGVSNDIARMTGTEQMTMDDFSMLRFDFCNGTLEELQQSRNEACGISRMEPAEANFQPSGGNEDPGCLLEPEKPTCPTDLQKYFESFPPQYPGGGEYESFVATITGVGIQNGLSNRTTPNYIATISILLPIAQAVKAATRPIWGGMPDDWPYAFRVIPFGVASAIEIAFQQVIRTAWYQNNRVNSAEIEATYENTRQLLDGSAAIWDEVVCRCAAEPRRGHGCDSRDNDCNHIVDECSEDTFAPEILVGQAYSSCSQRWFQSNEEALECVQNHILVEDDCSNIDPNEVSVTLMGGTEESNASCRSNTIVVQATDNCSNSNHHVVDEVYIDVEDPIVACGFGNERSSMLFLDERILNDHFLDVDLHYYGQDTCINNSLQVQVDVYSTEFRIENNERNTNMAFFVEDSSSPNRPGTLYVMNDVCGDGGEDRTSCVRSNPTIEGRDQHRIYTVVVSATDSSGRSSAIQAQCHIYVGDRRNNNLEIIAEAIEEASRFDKFHATSYSSKFIAYASGEDDGTNEDGDDDDSSSSVTPYATNDSDVSTSIGTRGRELRMSAVASNKQPP